MWRGRGVDDLGGSLEGRLQCVGRLENGEARVRTNTLLLRT